jgi:hypothetical protein
MKNKHKFHRFFQRIGLYLIKKLNLSGKEKLNVTELEVSIIFRKLLKDSSTELLISPLSGKYYLKSPKKEMLIILSNNELSIINHIYGYNVYIPNFLQERLRESFIDELEKRRFSMEEEFKKNVQHSLKNIINTFQNEK